MKRQLFVLPICLFAIIIVSATNVWAQEGTAADRYIGTWEFNIEGTEAGTLYMDLVVTEDEGELAATMGDPGLGFDMVFESIEATDSALTADAGIEGFPEADTQVKLMRRDETTMTVEMGEQRFVATKRE